MKKSKESSCFRPNGDAYPLCLGAKNPVEFAENDCYGCCLWEDLGTDDLGNGIPVIEFFMPMVPPTVTHQEKKITVRGGRPVVYEPQELKVARAKLKAHLAKHAPEKPLEGPVYLEVKWCFPAVDKTDGTYKDTKPDTDNLDKLLKDVMEELGFWKDDAQVASEHIEKFWAKIPGIYVHTFEITREKGLEAGK